MNHFQTGRFEPVGGQFTVTANAGESVDLDVIMRGAIPLDGKDRLKAEEDIRWQIQGDATKEFQIFMENSAVKLTISPVTVANASVYATYWTMNRQDFKFSLIRLIVRGKFAATLKDRNTIVHFGYPIILIQTPMSLFPIIFPA